MKTVTKTKGEDTEDALFFINCILKNNSVKTAFCTTPKNFRGEYKKQWKAQGALLNAYYIFLYRLLYFPIIFLLKQVQ